MLEVHELVCAHSPDSDDAYMFYAMATSKVRSPRVRVKHFLADIQTLNQHALEARHDLTAISYHAYPYIADKYQLMAAGSSVGDNYGPVVISTRPTAPESIKGKRVAVPGKMTTAYLTLKLFEQDFEPVPVPFDKIPDVVRAGEVDLGLVIHEAQLTHVKSGFFSVLDLGKWWKAKHNLPLPLGANALKRALPEDVKSEACRMMSASIQYALDHHEEALSYAMQFAEGVEQGLTNKFVGMYVNHHTVDCGDDVPKAAQLLYDLGFEAGVLPQRVQVDFVR